MALNHVGVMSLQKNRLRSAKNVIFSVRIVHFSRQTNGGFELPTPPCVRPCCGGQKNIKQEIRTKRFCSAKKLCRNQVPQKNSFLVIKSGLNGAKQEAILFEQPDSSLTRQKTCTDQ